MKPSDLAALLSGAYRRKITEEQILAVAVAGNLLAADGTINRARSRSPLNSGKLKAVDLYTIRVRPQLVDGPARDPAAIATAARSDAGPAVPDLTILRGQVRRLRGSAGKTSGSGCWAYAAVEWSRVDEAMPGTAANPAALPRSVRPYRFGKYSAGRHVLPTIQSSSRRILTPPAAGQSHR